MLRCNAGLFNDFKEINSMPQPKQRRPISPFDARSVLLFTALTMGGALAQAQGAPGSSAQSRYQPHCGRTLAGPDAILSSDAKPAAAPHAGGMRS